VGDDPELLEAVAAEPPPLVQEVGDGPVEALIGHVGGLVDVAVDMAEGGGLDERVARRVVAPGHVRAHVDGVSILRLAPWTGRPGGLADPRASASARVR
jgi:hypothetical protein